MLVIQYTSLESEYQNGYHSSALFIITNTTTITIIIIIIIISSLYADYRITLKTRTMPLNMYTSCRISAAASIPVVQRSGGLCGPQSGVVDGFGDLVVNAGGMYGVGRGVSVGYGVPAVGIMLVPGVEHRINISKASWQWSRSISSDIYKPLGMAQTGQYPVLVTFRFFNIT